MRQQQATASCWINCGNKHRKNRQRQGRWSLGSQCHRQGTSTHRAGDEEKQTYTTSVDLLIDKLRRCSRMLRLM